jgi:hypothetical protein
VLRTAAGILLFGVLFLRLFGWRFYTLARGCRRIRRGEVLLDQRGPPDGEVAAGADADFFLAITVLW